MTLREKYNLTIFELLKLVVIVFLFFGHSVCIECLSYFLVGCDVGVVLFMVFNESYAVDEIYEQRQDSYILNYLIGVFFSLSLIVSGFYWFSMVDSLSLAVKWNIYSRHGVKLFR